MDGDVIEMTREELQQFIRDSVNCRQLPSPDVLKKLNQLQLLQKKKEKLSSDLLQLSESVLKCEASVRQLYSSLGWEYTNTDSEDDNSNDKTSDYEAPYIEAHSGCSSSATNKTGDVFPTEEHVESASKSKKQSPKLLKELRVLVERLPDNARPKRKAASETSKRLYSEDEFSNASGSDTAWQPSEESSDSDFTISSTNSDTKKRNVSKAEKCAMAEAKGIPHVTPVPQATSVAEASAHHTKHARKTEPSVKPAVKQEMKHFAVNDKVKPANVLPDVPKEVCVGMEVLARRKKMRWERGTVAEIISKVDGTKKFKVTFEDRGKMLVSGHHLAYDAMPKLVHLSIGGRVLSKYKSDQMFFTPGILAELPSRKNHMRFLVFFDDHTSIYVALPVLRIVCKPLPDPLDDIRDEEHKSFLKEYLLRMPYPPQTQFNVGHSLKVELDGVFQVCTVEQVDSSLMEVVFEKDEHKEWIYRGSIRLEHILNMKKDKVKNKH